MKLINRTYIGSLLLSVPVIIIGTIFCFYIIRYINHEETDEYLTYEMHRITDYYNTHGILPEFNSINHIKYNVNYPHPQFSDTLLLETGDNEFVPYRQLCFSMEHKGEKHTIVLSHLLMGNDDILEGTLLIIVGLVFLTFIFQTLMIRLVNRRLWKPFYVTLSKLQSFRIDNAAPELTLTGTEEFDTLNKRLQLLLEKVVRDYKSNKEFNENASHELQTHLAVIRSRTESLINTSLNDSPEIHDIYRAANKLSQIQKSLLLLSKISNNEFSKEEQVNLKELVQNTLGIFEENFEIRNIRITTTLNDSPVFMDKGLAGILINNLVKNALRHNVENGYMDIVLDSRQLTVRNSGKPFSGNPELMFQRFASGNGESTGIGLAIVKQICDIYHHQVSFTIDMQTHYSLQIIFNK